MQSFLTLLRKTRLATYSKSVDTLQRFGSLSYKGYQSTMPIKFDKDGRFHIYHSETGEQFLNNLTRINMVFIGGNTMLLILELTSPFFGYWHGMSLLATVLLNLLGSRMLHYYSTRMINNLWLLRDGKTVEVEFMSAFFLAKRQRCTIRNFGYLAPSRVYNVSVFTY